MDNDSYKLLIPTAWIPLVDANKENGCMEVGEEIVVESKLEVSTKFVYLFMTSERLKRTSIQLFLLLNRRLRTQSFSRCVLKRH